MTTNTSKTDLIFDALSDGIVFFGPTGAARYVNKAARDLYGPRVETLYTDERVQRALGEVKSGNAKLPVVVEIDFARAGELLPIRATILDWKAGGGHTFVLAAGAPQSTARPNHDLPATFALIRRELVPPIEALVAALRAQAIADPELDARARELVARLQQLGDLSEAFGTDAILTDERVALRPVIEEVWSELMPLAAQRSVRLALHRFDHNLPPIYGSRRWIKRALAELVHNAITHGLAGRSNEEPAMIEIAASLEGHWLAIELANRGLGIRNLPSGRELLPFANARQQLTTGAAGLGAGLPLVQQIVELHGGNLDIGIDELEMVRVTLRLPTGAPLGISQQFDVEQAQRYARDLAKLLARRSKQSA